MACLYCKLCRTRPRKTPSGSPSWPQPSFACGRHHEPAAEWLSDFDQSFYLTIAYDLDRYGVFSNGVFDETDSTRTAPAPACFSFRAIRCWCSGR